MSIIYVETFNYNRMRYIQQQRNEKKKKLFENVFSSSLYFMKRLNLQIPIKIYIQRINKIA